MKHAIIESIEPTGTDGFFIATLQIHWHGEAITVIGSTLTECVERAVTVLTAFNKPPA